jgi:KAP family P-loop domain/CHAT domain
MATLEFRLTVDVDRVRVQVPWGEPYTEPFDLDPLVRRQLAVFSRQLARRTLSTREELEVFGRQLAATLLTGAVGKDVAGTLARTDSSGEQLRIVLEFAPRTDELAALPWEYLFVDEPRRGFLSTFREVSLVRRVQTEPRRVDRRPAKPPLQLILATGGASETSMPLERGIEPLRGLLEGSRVEIRSLQAAELFQLREVAEKVPRPKVVHFTGFTRPGGAPEIALADPGGEPRWVHAGDVIDLLRAADLVVMDLVPEGGRPDEGEAASLQLGRVALALAPLVETALLANQLPWTESESARFFETFYKALADGVPVDRAAQQARSPSLTPDERDALPSFGVSVLYLQDPSANVLLAPDERPARATATRPTSAVPPSPGPPPPAEELLEPLGGGYDADDAEDPDRRDALGFKGDANMLCGVLADKYATPPLSVGLFGEWGSGKSFFMGLMRRRIEALAAAAYQAEQAGKETSYCSRVVQITFNAWHYMDANLWASLAVEIFNRLATPPPPGRPAPTAVEAERERVERERRRVLQRLDTYQRLVAELAENHQRAEQERSRVEQELAAAASQRQSVARSLAAVVSGDITAALDQDPQLTKLRTQAATALGLPEVPSAELPTLVSDLRKVSGQAGLTWRLLARRKGTWTFALAAAFTIALLVGVVLLAVRGGRELGAGSIAVSLAAMAGLAARVGPVVGAVHRGLGLAEGALRYADSLERRIREQRTARQVELEAELRGLMAQEQSLSAQLAEATAKAAEARAEAEDLRDGRRLRRFLQERSGSADYRRHLGLISLLHQDFQQLSVLLQLAQQAREQAEGPEEDDKEQLPRIDRIILYIDDLDRCPPARVVEVLQAMHLLLALPLFVVVVGVDPRWLLRSLQRHYRALLTSPGAERAAPGDVSHWASTPQNYLEKIFQIPFALAPMTRAGFQRLVTDLATSTRRPTPADGQTDAAEEPGPPAPQAPATSGKPEPASPAPEPHPAPTTSGVDAEPTIQAEDATTGAQLAGATLGRAAERSQASLTDPQVAERQQIVVDEGSAASVEHPIDPNPTGLTLTDAEIDFIQALAPMVATPRAGKRLVNIYRMIRSTQAIGGGSRFLSRDPADGGEYQVVLQLLAAVSGMPYLAGPTFTALLQADRDGSWRAFVDHLLPAPDPPHGNAIHPRLNDAQATEWRRLHAGLAAVRDEIPVLDELGPYQEWVPRIARFSFASGRLLGDTLTTPAPRSNR